MKTICLYFQVHQPFRFRRYRFFDIGNDHYYYDDYSNESILRKVAAKCYLPANSLLRDLIREFDGKFRVSFSISGLALDQFELYAPDVLESFRQLADTGSVEFLSETNAHSLVALKNRDEFIHQVNIHAGKIKKYFGQKPVVFRNTELVYSDAIGSMVADMGYKGMLTEGAKQILGWKSPNYLYYNAVNPKLKILLRNFKLSDDIAFRFSNKNWNEWPLTAEKFAGWLKTLDKQEEIINLFMDYETFGEHQWAETGIFDFLKAFPGTILSRTKFTFSTPSEIVEKFQPVAAVQVPHPISWADEERDLTAWLGNELQEEAFNKLYSLSDRVNKCNDPGIARDWDYLQASDHFYYMCTKFFSDGAVHAYFNPYESPYDAFINYMNVFSDFQARVDTAIPETGVDKELTRLNQLIGEKEKQIEKYRTEIEILTTPKAGKPSTRKTVTRESTTVAGKGATRKTAGSIAEGKKTSTHKDSAAPAGRKTSTKKTTATGKSSKKIPVRSSGTTTPKSSGRKTTGSRKK